MDKKLTPLQKIRQFLLIALDHAAPDGERVNAIRAIDRYLPSAGVDKYGLVERIEQEPASKEEMERVFEAGYAKRLAEEAALRRNLAAITTYGEDNGVNGYSWKEVANYCLLNKQRIRNSWEANFVESVAGQLNSRGFHEPTERQKPILQRIFTQWFNGAIR